MEAAYGEGLRRLSRQMKREQAQEAPCSGIGCALTGGKTRWIRRGVDRIVSYAEARDELGHMHAAHAALMSLKICIALASAVWLLSRGRLKERVNVLVTRMLAVFIIASCALICYRLRRFAMTPTYTSPEVVILHFWEGSLVWWCMVLLIACTICAVTPSLKKYIYYLF